MDFEFLVADPRRFDEASIEVCACSIWSDVRPLQGLAGLLDWRLGGRLSALLKSGFATGERAETLLLPGKPHVSFDKILVLGLGRRSTFDDDAFRDEITRVARALERLRVRRCVLELPGRGSEAIDPERAISLAWSCVAASGEHDAWWIVDTAEARETMATKAGEERRKARTL